MDQSCQSLSNNDEHQDQVPKISTFQSETFNSSSDDPELI